MKAIKGNVQLMVTGRAQANAYRAEGFDIYDDKGRLMMHAAGKKIGYEEHCRIVEKLEEKIAVLEGREAGKQGADK